MVFSTLAFTWLCLAQNPAPLAGDVVPMSKRNFSIPITVEEKRRPEIRQLILFTSLDQGQNWSQVMTSTPDKASFPFKAPQDGLYWFSVGVVDQNGKQQPESPYTSAPALKVLVDTTTPALKITSAERIGDEAVVNWEIQEERPDLGSVRLEYRPADSNSFSPWINVPLTASGPSGRIQFRPTSPAALTVRMEVKDQAGNVGTAQKEVAAGPTAVTGGTPPAGNPLAASNRPTPGTFPVPGDRQASLPPQAGRTEPLASADHLQGSVPVYPRSDYSPAGTAPLPYSPAAGSPLPAESNPIQPIACSGTDSPAAGVAPAQYRGSLPKAQLVNDPHVGVEYSLSKFGASGIGKVELWITRDEGVTWQYLTDDPDVAGRDPAQKQRLMAMLPGEGVFGMRLVTQSGAGLGREPPKSGDLPQLRIEVDTKAPVVKLYPPQPDQIQRDTLVLTWSAQDRNLAAKPITLEYAAQKEGPWQTIVADLPNTGTYSWQVPKSVPYQAYLRVSAVDLAGNRSVAEAKEPSLIDLNKPEGILLGIAVQTRTTGPAPSRDDRSPPVRPRKSGFDFHN